MDNMRRMLGVIQIDNLSPRGQKNHQIDFVTEIDENKYQELREAISTLDKFIADSQLFTLVVWNYQDFIQTIKSYLIAFRARDNAIFREKDIYIEINRCFLNLLSSIRSYLDHMDTIICDRYGKESLIREIFISTVHRNMIPISHIDFFID
jgi:hypothetical protein